MSEISMPGTNHPLAQQQQPVPKQDAPSIDTKQKSEQDVESIDFTFKQSIIGNPIKLRFTSGQEKQYLSGTYSHEAADDTAYLIIHFEALNEGHSPFYANANQVVLTTADGTTYEPDFELSMHQRRNENLPDGDLQLQPGVPKQTLVVFELAISKLQRAQQPTLHCGNSNSYFGNIPLYPDDTKASSQDIPASKDSPSVVSNNTDSNSSASDSSANTAISNSVPPLQESSNDPPSAQTSPKDVPADVYVSNASGILFDDREAASAWYANTPYKGIEKHGTDKIDVGSKVTILATNDGYAEVQVIDGSLLTDGQGSGWFPEKRLTKLAENVHIEREHPHGLGATMEETFGNR